MKAMFRAFRAILAGLAIAGFATGAAAQSYPTKPVRMIVPFPPGGATDIAARIVGMRLSELWGQQVIIENRGGAGGGVGAAEAARATPDGYTLFFPSGSVVTANQHIYQKLPYDPMKDFIPITNVVSGPQIVVVPAKSPYRTLKDLLDDARKNPGKLTFGSAGIGSQVHLAAENLVYTGKLDAVHVPYKGEGPALVGLIGGETSFMVTNLAAGIVHVNGGRLRALAVTSRARASQMPDVPTVAETLPGFENTGWFGMVAPAGTPPQIVRKIYEDTRKALDSTDVRARFYTQGMSMVLNSPEAFGKAMREESALWAKVVRERKISVK